jgi:RNase adaptor protein for sRNA GlmZ degradation
MTGNGGGYVFDCRSIHNPGRYAPYKALTGRDEPVIRFLEEDGEILQFLEHVYGVVDPHVETYASRGFTSLMISFGCTGGQHRSVYCAEHLARHLASKYPHIRICLSHREQKSISPIVFNAN